MKVYKVTLIFSVLVFMAVGVFWILGFFNSEMAKDVASKLIGLVLLMGVGSGAMLAVASRDSASTKNPSEEKKPGPNF